MPPTPRLSRRSRRAATTAALAALVTGSLCFAGATTANAADVVVTPVCAQPAAIVNHAISSTAARDVAAGSVEVSAGALPPGVTLTPDFLLTGTPTAVASYSYTLKSRYLLGDGTTVASKETKCSMTVKVDPVVSRLQGADRYQTAVEVSAKLFGTAPVVYVVSGEKFADALSASGVAGIHEAPILLTPRDSAPEAVLAEIRRLKATEIALVGGVNTISDAVKAQLAKETPATVTRIIGSDRYEVSRNLFSNPLFGNTSGKAPTFASGLDYPDALSAGPAAVHGAQSVVLMNGHATEVSPTEVAFIRERGFTSGHVVGGSDSFTNELAQNLSHIINFDVGIGARVSGANRYETSVAINQAFTTADRVYLASGTGFADALSGAAAASHFDSPLFTVQGDCVPAGVLSSIYRLAPSQIVLLGGDNTLSPAVEKLTPCA